MRINNGDSLRQRNGNRVVIDNNDVEALGFSISNFFVRCHTTIHRYNKLRPRFFKAIHTQRGQTISLQ